MVVDPFAELGLGPDADIDDVRDARRRLAMQHHPDRGGDAARMRAVNEAADAALASIARRQALVPTPDTADVDDMDDVDDGEDLGDVETPRERSSTVTRDVPSFTVEAQLTETFEALLIVAATIGEVLDADPPHRLDAYLTAPLDCWCRLDVLADAGSATVSLTVAGLDDQPAPSIVTVRDAWVTHLNALDWPA